MIGLLSSQVMIGLLSSHVMIGLLSSHVVIAARRPRAVRDLRDEAGSLLLRSAQKRPPFLSGGDSRVAHHPGFRERAPVGPVSQRTAPRPVVEDVLVPLGYLPYRSLHLHEVRLDGQVH